MNWQHLRTFLWLKWRLRMNQMRRAGTGSMIIERIAMIIMVVVAATAFILFLIFGLFGVQSLTMMLVWDAMVAGFIMFWLTELLVELQRSELLSLDRFLHLPVPLSGVFLINYLGSILTPSAIIFLAASMGFSIGLLLSYGPKMLLLFPLLAAFTLAITAITYQFRGWLAALMVNKRRRRTILTLVTFGFVLIFQIPNFIGMATGWGNNREQNAAFRRETGQLNRQLRDGEIDRAEFQSRLDAVYKKYGRARNEGFIAESAETLTTVNKVVPLGWLPYGARRSAEGDVLPAILGTVGLAFVGALSLRRSFNTTIKLYTGVGSTKRSRTAPATRPRESDAAVSTGTKPGIWLEQKLPWVSEHAAAVALAALRSLLRAPEAKLMLLSPLILAILFGSYVLRLGQDPVMLPELTRPLVASGAITLVLAMMFQMSGNQFGFDRNGFRAYVLAPVPRQDILVGKNLALMPFALGMSALLLLALQIFMPMRVDHLLGALMQMVSMYLLFCILTNFLSILAPTAIAAGSLKPVKPKGMAILLGIFFFFLFPLMISPTLIPLAIEFLLEWTNWLSWIPAYFLLNLGELAIVFVVYRKAIELQGRLLQAREQRILEVVTVKVE